MSPHHPTALRLACLLAAGDIVARRGDRRLPAGRRRATCHHCADQAARDRHGRTHPQRDRRTHECTRQIQPQAAEATEVGSSILDDLLAKDTTRPGAGRNLDLMQDDLFDKAWRIAEVMASGKTTVPQHLRGNTGDCLAVCMQAPMEHEPVRGGAKDAHRQRRARIRGTVCERGGAAVRRDPWAVHYEFDDKGPACRVGAILRGEREITWGEWLSAARSRSRTARCGRRTPSNSSWATCRSRMGARLLPRSDPRRLQRRRTRRRVTRLWSRLIRRW